MFLLVYLVGMGAATVPDKSWEFTRSDGAIISFYATIPLTVDFKVKNLERANNRTLQDLDEAYDDCLTRNMSLATVSTEEEQTEVYQKINDHLSKVTSPPVAYWVGLKRGQGPKGDQTKEFSWMYPYNGNQRRCPLTQKHPTFWVSTKPDHNSDLNCVNMLFNFGGTFPQLGPLKNWNGEKCDHNYSGVQGNHTTFKISFLKSKATRTGIFAPIKLRWFNVPSNSMAVRLLNKCQCSCCLCFLSNNITE